MPLQIVLTKLTITSVSFQNSADINAVTVSGIFSEAAGILPSNYIQNVSLSISAKNRLANFFNKFKEDLADELDIDIE